MEEVLIKRIEVIGTGELLVTPSEPNDDLFPYIYRTATGVSWNAKKEAFSSQVPREWSYVQWFHNILLASAESELGIKLVIAPDTEWVNIPTELKHQIES